MPVHRRFCHRNLNMTHHLTPWQQLAVEAIQEDERLTAGLDDAQAGELLR